MRWRDNFFFTFSTIDRNKLIYFKDKLKIIILSRGKFEVFNLKWKYESLPTFTFPTCSTPDSE